MANGGEAVLGIDLGGTNLRIAVADLEENVLHEAREATDPRGGSRIIGQIADLATRTLNGTVLHTAAMAVAGVPDAASGVVRLAPNLPGFDRIDVAGQLSRALGCPVEIENDVNMAALGEQRLGCGSEVRDFAFIAFGTGIGMGLISNGMLVRGARGAAGEIAHLPLGGDPLNPASHSEGALEAAIGSRAIVERYRALGGEAADVRSVFNRLADGDGAADRVMDEVALLLAKAVLAVRAIADPERFVLGGSIGVRPELIERVRSLVARAGGDPLKLEPSALGDRAALLGAVSVALDGLAR